MDILLATNNEHKVEEIAEILNKCPVRLRNLKDFPDFPKPVEDGKTYRENALKKALHYHKLTGLPTVADDSGIEIDALEGKPGIYSARFIAPDIGYDERNRGVLNMLSTVPNDGRGARFRCCCVLVYSEDDIRAEYGTLEGRIGHELKGEHGFGYDPIFYLPNRRLYLAEVPPEEKNRISHRAIAFEKIKKHLDGRFE